MRPATTEVGPSRASSRPLRGSPPDEDCLDEVVPPVPSAHVAETPAATSSVSRSPAHLWRSQTSSHPRAEPAPSPASCSGRRPSQPRGRSRPPAKGGGRDRLAARATAYAGPGSSTSTRSSTARWWGSPRTGRPRPEVSGMSSVRSDPPGPGSRSRRCPTALLDATVVKATMARARRPKVGAREPAEYLAAPRCESRDGGSSLQFC